MNNAFVLTRIANLLRKIRYSPTSHFYLSSSCASAVISVVILSVRPSVTRVLCDKTTADILISHERAIIIIIIIIIIIYSYSNVKSERRPLPSEICAQSDPPPSKNADLDRFPLIMSRS